VLERQPDQAIWDRGGKQLLYGFRERIYIGRPVQAQQGPGDGGIDDWLALHIDPGHPILERACERDRHRLAQAQGLRAFPQDLQQSEIKKSNLS